MPTDDGNTIFIWQKYLHRYSEHKNWQVFFYLVTTFYLTGSDTGDTFGDNFQMYVHVYCCMIISYRLWSTLWATGPEYFFLLDVQYIPRNMHMVFALLCFVVVIHWLIFPYPSGLLHWHCGNLTIAPVPAKQPWWIWINTSCEFIMNDCITTTKQSTTKLCASFLGYTVYWIWCKFDYIVLYMMESSALLFDNKGNCSMSDAHFSIFLIKPGIANLRYCLI